MTHRRLLRKPLLATLFLFCWTGPAWTSAASADASPFAGRERVTDAQLDQMRAGYKLPNGMDISIGIEIRTLVDGALALRTVLSAGDAAGLSVFTGGAAANGEQGPASSAQEGTVAALPGGGTVRIVEGPVSAAPADTGQQKIELTPNGPSSMTQWGSVRLQQDESGSVVVLSGNSLELHHMMGSLTGTLIANTANDRAIDTIVTVNVDLNNSAVPIGNAMLRWESIALDAAGRGIH